MTIYIKYTSIYAGKCRRLFRKNLQSNIKKCKLLSLCKRGERGGFHKKRKCFGHWPWNFLKSGYLIRNKIL